VPFLGGGRDEGGPPEMWNVPDKGGIGRWKRGGLNKEEGVGRCPQYTEGGEGTVFSGGISNRRRVNWGQVIYRKVYRD